MLSDTYSLINSGWIALIVKTFSMPEYRSIVILTGRHRRGMPINSMLKNAARPFGFDPAASIVEFDALHILVGKAKMVADLMDQHVTDDDIQPLAGIAPEIQ